MTELEQRLAGLDYPFPQTPDLAGAAGRRRAVGTGALGPAEDGVPATEVGILPSDVAFAPDGALLFSQTEPEPAVRRVDPEIGVVTTLFR
jgi:streptogramin lyase